MKCPLKLSDTLCHGWSKVDMWQMNREPLVFSHQEHYGWDLERRNAKNKMWSNSPDGWSVWKIEQMTFSECDFNRIATASAHSASSHHTNIHAGLMIKLLHVGRKLRAIYQQNLWPHVNHSFRYRCSTKTPTVSWFQPHFLSSICSSHHFQAFEQCRWVIIQMWLMLTHTTY